MSKVVDDANALAAAAAELASEVQAEENGTVTDKTIDNIVVNYTDGTSVTVVSPGDTPVDPIPAAPVVTPVTDAPAPTSETSEATDGASEPQAPAEVPEGGTEVAPTVAGVVPE